MQPTQMAGRLYKDVSTVSVVYFWAVLTLTSHYLSAVQAGFSDLPDMPVQKRDVGYVIDTCLCCRQVIACQVKTDAKKKPADTVLKSLQIVSQIRRQSAEPPLAG